MSPILTAPANRTRARLAAGTRFVGMTNWQPGSENEYLDRLVDALADGGVAVRRARLAPLAVAVAWVRGMRAVHVHWPEYLVRPSAASQRDVAIGALQIGRLLLGLLACKLLRVRVVWTVHNLGPHDAEASWAARRAYQLVCRAADVFVVHSAAAGARAEEKFPRGRGRLVVMPHGHYLGVHPEPVRTRAETRAALGIPEDAFLLLAFGQVRGYKRLVELGRAVAEADADDLHLLVVGRVVEPQLEAELEAVAAASDRVHLDLRRVPGEEVPELFAAADAAAINYAELFSSGTLLLALSMGLPVVSADSDAGREVAPWPALATFEATDELPGVVERLGEADPSARREAALGAARAASWERSAEVVAAAAYPASVRGG